MKSGRLIGGRGFLLMIPSLQTTVEWVLMILIAEFQPLEM